VPRLVHRTHDTVRSALVARVALLLAGDDVVIDLRLDPGLTLEVVETAGTVAYDMRGGRASWRLRGDIGAGACLVWDGKPLVVSTGADVERSTDLSLAAGATVLLRECLVFGRSGEVGGDLRASTYVTHDGQPLLCEELDLACDHRGAFAVLDTRRCLDTLALLGMRLDDGPDVLQLAGPGSVARAITDHVHESAIDSLALATRTLLSGAAVERAC
jgi:urease accessory protein